MDTSLPAALGLGLLLGLRHATDADHIAAVSTFVSRDRNVLRSCLVGTCWGAGHALAMLIAGLGAFAFKITIPAEMAQVFERAVGLVLILLGGHVVLRALGSPNRGHVHLGRPFLVGMLHGLAGSATLTLLVLAAVPSPLAGLLYLAVFGIGATAGMLVLGGVIAVPFVFTVTRSERWHAGIRVAAGAISLVLGVRLVWTGSA